MAKMKNTVLGCCIVLSISLAGCSHVELVSRYDSATDEGAAAMQKDLSDFFIRMETSVSPNEKNFGANQSFYRKQAVAVGALQLRAPNTPNNALTIEQLQLVEDNLAYLALLHKGCVKAALTDAQRTAVREKGIDASIECRTAYGASMEAKDQSRSVLNPVMLTVLAGQFDSSLGAIMKLEIAKKRGEE
jgi:hypothetical protein